MGFLLTIPWMVILGPGLAVSWILGWESHLEDPTGVTWGLLALMVLTNALLAALFVEILGRRPRRWPVFRRIQLATTLAAAVATLAIQGMAWADPVGGDPMPDLLTTPWLIVLGPGLTISRIIRPGRDVGGASEVTGGLLVLMALTNASLAAIFVEILGLAGRALCALTEFLSRL